jgi:DNA primase
MTAEIVKASVAPREFYRVELPGMPAPKRDHGWTDAGLCVFHPDMHKGNFRINLDSGAFCCFACGVKGADVIAFTQTRHGLSFPDALKAIADAWEIRR